MENWRGNVFLKYRSEDLNKKKIRRKKKLLVHSFDYKYPAYRVSTGRKLYPSTPVGKSTIRSFPFEWGHQLLVNRLLYTGISFLLSFPLERDEHSSSFDGLYRLWLEVAHFLLFRDYGLFRVIMRYRVTCNPYFPSMQDLRNVTTRVQKIENNCWGDVT